MNWIDALILLTLVIPIFIGYRRGLLRTVMPLVAAVCGVVVAGIFHESMADLLASRIHNLALANVVAFVLVFGLFMTAGITLLSIGRRFLRNRYLCSIPPGEASRARSFPSAVLFWALLSQASSTALWLIYSPLGSIAGARRRSSPS